MLRKTTPLAFAMGIIRGTPANLSALAPRGAVKISGVPAIISGTFRRSSRMLVGGTLIPRGVKFPHQRYIVITRVHYCIKQPALLNCFFSGKSQG